LQVWEQSRSPVLLPVIGVAAGFSYAVKYTGFLALLVALGFLLWKARPRFGAAVKVALFASLFVVPWMAKNLIVVGNPVAPFFNRLFPNPYFYVSSEQSYLNYMRHYEGLGEQHWRDYLSIPWELAGAGEKLQGMTGPLFLLAPLGLFALRHSLGRRAWLAAVLFAMPWLANQGTRFWIPSLVFLSLVMALSIWQAPPRLAMGLAAIAVTGHAVASWPSVIERWNRRPVWRLDLPPWKAAARWESEDVYLSRKLAGYRLTRMIEETLPPGARVLSPDAVSEAYTSREVLVSYQSALGDVLTDHLLTPVVPELAPVWNIRLSFGAQDLQGIRVLQTGSDKMENWSIHELLLYAGENQIPPKPDWLLRARPNPWDAAMAMDSNPATRWRSWWPLFPGMSFQVDLPSPLRLSAVELHCSSDQQQLTVRVEGKVAPGRWLPLEAQVSREELYPPRRKMKKLATSEVKRRGVDYLLFDLEGDGFNLIAADIDRNPAAWGLREVGLWRSRRLYYIE